VKKKNLKNTPFNSFFLFLGANFEEKNWHPKNVGKFLIFFLKNYETFYLR